MAEEPKPQASFLAGKKAPVAAEAAAPGVSAPPPPAPAAFAPPPLQPAPPPQFSAAPAAAPTQPPVTAGNRALAEQYLQRGLDHYDRQESDAALAAYQQCIQADPSFGLGYNNLGMVLIDLGRYEEAVGSLYASIRCDPSYGEAYNNLGFVLRRMQQHVEATAVYTRYLELEPEVEEGPKIQAWIATVLQENNLAVAPAFVLPPEPGAAPPPAPPQPESWPAPSEPAPVAPAAPEPEPAAPAPPPVPPSPPEAAAAPPKIKKMAGWEVAVAPPETAAPVSALGEVGAAAEAPPVASEPAAAPVAAEVAPVDVAPAAGALPEAAAGDMVALVERGMDQFADGNLTEAAATFQQVIELDPNCAEAHVGLAKVLVRQDRLEDAVGLLQRAVQLDPADPAGFYVLGFALRAVERNVEAAEAYEQFLQLMPDAADAEKIRQWITHVKTIAGRASGTYEEVVIDDEQIVTDLDKKYKNALTKFQEGDVDTAMRECIRILNEDAGHVRTRVLLGRAYLRQKAYDNALEQFENALVTQPDYPEALYFLGQAAEKKGLLDKAVSSYKRYLEVAPSGPRAERLRDWLISHGAPEVSSGASKQAQCELCLRFFPESEITQHEGRATCRNCLAVMGAAPMLSTPELAAAAETPAAMVSTPVEPDAAPPKRSKGVAVLGAVACLAVAAGVLFYLGKLNPLLLKLGILKPDVTRIKPPPPPPPPPPPELTFDASKVKISNEPQVVVKPFARWTYTPELEGLANLDQFAPGWKKEYVLKDAPKGMTIAPDTGEVSWTPELADTAALKQFKCEVSVKGTGKPADGATKELFAVSKAFVLSCQFGYELGPEIDLGLEPGDRPAIGVGEFNGDDLVDAVICSGRFRSGLVRLYLQRRNNPLPPPIELDKGTHFSALHVCDVDGAKGADLVVADWQRGRIKLFCQNEQGLAAGASLTVGAGPVALSAGDMDGDKRIKIAVLSSVARTLTVAGLSPERQLSTVATIPVLSGGPRAFLHPWTSAALGPGFVIVVPLAESPIQFIPSNNGNWNKGQVPSVESNIAEEGVVTAAAPLAAGGKSSGLLAVILAGKESRLVLFRELEGKFTPVGAPVVLPGLGLGLLAHDFNQDGQDDLFAVTDTECGFYFARGPKLLAGPRLATPVRMLGPVAKFAAGSVERPDLLLINENRTAQIAKAIVVAPPEPAPAAETPAAPANAAQPGKERGKAEKGEADKADKGVEPAKADKAGESGKGDKGGKAARP